MGIKALCLIAILASVPTAIQSPVEFAFLFCIFFFPILGVIYLNGGIPLVPQESIAARR